MIKLASARDYLQKGRIEEDREARDLEAKERSEIMTRLPQEGMDKDHFEKAKRRQEK